MNRPAEPMTTRKGRSGLSQRIAERGQLVVVGKITKVDDGGFYARKACLEDLKRDAWRAELERCPCDCGKPMGAPDYEARHR